MARCPDSWSGLETTTGTSSGAPESIPPCPQVDGTRSWVGDFLEGRADVHQKRAKRRELAEPTAVRLPRVSQAPRRRAQREVSYLSNRKQAPRDPSSVPASMIPVRHRT